MQFSKLSSFRLVFLLIGLSVFIFCGSAGALESQWPNTTFRNRVFHQFAMGPALMYYTIHRSFNDPTHLHDEVPKEKWWHFVGIGRNFSWTTAYVFKGGFIIGGNISGIFTRGMDSRFDTTDTASPDNPGETITITAGPVLGKYPIENWGWTILMQPGIGYSTLSNDAPTGSIRVSTGYEWPAGPSGALGFNLEGTLYVTNSEEDERPYFNTSFDSVHVPISVILNVCLKGFGQQK